MQVIDYRSSFTINYSARDGSPKNICRTLILAKCALINEQTGESGEYFLGKACIGEHMYMDIGIAQEPTSEVSVIFNESETSLQKKFVNHEDDVVQSGPWGMKHRGFDGGYAYSTDLQFILTATDARPLATPQEIARSTLAGEPMVGRTTLSDGGLGWSALLEYPIVYVNLQPGHDRFQVDVGPVLYPDLSSTPDMLVDRLRFAYIMYNSFDEAEFAIRVPTSVAEGQPAETLHYSRVIKVAATHQVFSLAV